MMKGTTIVTVAGIPIATISSIHAFSPISFGRPLKNDLGIPMAKEKVRIQCHAIDPGRALIGLKERRSLPKRTIVAWDAHIARAEWHGATDWPPEDVRIGGGLMMPKTLSGNPCPHLLQMQSDGLNGTEPKPFPWRRLDFVG